MNPAPTSPSAPAPPKAWTVRALLAWTIDFLKNKGNDDAKLDAELLLAHVLACKRIELFVRYDELPTDAERTKFRELIQRRVAGWPVAYLLGSREFFLLTFEVNPAVLIPRSDTETLVAEAVERLKPLAAPEVLDLGTGSGCVAVSIAHRLKGARVTATDLSPDALAVAQKNAEKLGVAARVEFRHGDLFAAVPTGSAFDLIASNPPYIAHGEFAALDADVRDHEPRLALDGGPDGLAFYRRIASAAGAFLKPGGSLLLEVGYTQDASVRALLAERGEFEVGPTRKDGSGHPRVVSAKRRIG
jgi:release factor glutamine methyltransferase